MNNDPENPYRPFRDSTWDEPNPTIRAELRQRLIDKGVTPKRADVLLKLADAKAKT